MSVRVVLMFDDSMACLLLQKPRRDQDAACQSGIRCRARTRATNKMLLPVGSSG
jgi:hypothetical protein